MILPDHDRAQQRIAACRLQAARRDQLVTIENAAEEQFRFGAIFERQSIHMQQRLQLRKIGMSQIYYRDRHHDSITPGLPPIQRLDTNAMHFAVHGLERGNGQDRIVHVLFSYLLR